MSTPQPTTSPAHFSLVRPTTTSLLVLNHYPFLAMFFPPPILSLPTCDRRRPIHTSPDLIKKGQKCLHSNDEVRARVLRRAARSSSSSTTIERRNHSTALLLRFGLFIRLSCLLRFHLKKRSSQNRDTAQPRPKNLNYFSSSSYYRGQSSMTPRSAW